MLIDDNPAAIRLLTNLVEATGNLPIPFDDGQPAVRYLQDHHTEVALIISDLKMPSLSGQGVLQARNEVDPYLPFYIISGKAEPVDTFAMAKANLDGYISKEYLSSGEIRDILRQQLESLLFEHISIQKKPFLIKIGGSADDFDQETDSLALRDVLETLVELQSEQQYQVLVAVGAGKSGDLTKRRRAKHGDYSPALRREYPFDIRDDLLRNMRFLYNLIGAKHATYMAPYQLSREGLSMDDDRAVPYSGLEAFSTGRQERFFNQEKVIILGSAPRHLGLGHPDIVDPQKSSYPNIAYEHSDAQMMLWAQALGCRQVTLCKRTDGVYLYDPYTGFNADATLWRNQQQHNARLNTVSYQELLDGKTKDGRDISLIGSFDGQGDHLLETEALKLGLKFNIAAGIVHIHNQELFPDGHHVVTNEPESIMAAHLTLEDRIRELARGKQCDIMV